MPQRSNEASNEETHHRHRAPLIIISHYCTSLVPPCAIRRFSRRIDIYAPSIRPFKQAIPTMISIRPATLPADHSRIRLHLRLLPPQRTALLVVVSLVFALCGQSTHAFTSIYQRPSYYSSSPPQTCRHHQPPRRGQQPQPPPHGSRTTVFFSASSSSTRYNYQEDLLPGITAIDTANPELFQQLNVLRDKPYFRFYSIDILASCEYMPQELYECYTQTCEIYPEDGEQVRFVRFSFSFVVVLTPLCLLVVSCQSACLVWLAS
jgi:Endoplasmic Reticulum Oxidoreductin 1 (ERO1)